MSEVDKPERVSVILCNALARKLDYLSRERKIPKSRLIALAVDNEFLKEKPFDFELDSIEDEEFVDYAYVTEAGRIIDYLKGNAGHGLDILMLARHDMGIPDRKTFLLAFRECWVKGFLEMFKPVKNRFSKAEYNEDYVMYRLKGEGTKEKMKLRRKASDYEKFQRLKKKFKDE
jgi:hypothetical protein